LPIIWLKPCRRAEIIDTVCASLLALRWMPYCKNCLCHRFTSRYSSPWVRQRNFVSGWSPSFSDSSHQMKMKIMNIFCFYWTKIHSVQWDEVPKIRLFTNCWVGWVWQSNLEWNSVIYNYNVNSFSLLIACYLVGLDEQFFRKIEMFVGQRWAPSP